MFVLMTAGMWVGMLGCANGKAVVGTEQAVSKGRGKDRSVQYFPYCYPDNCPERFEGEPYVAFFSIGNCQYRVRYYKRPKSPCQSYCMIAIDRIDVLSPSPCDQTDIRELMDSAMTAAIRNLVGDRDYAGCFPENNGDCVDFWRIVRGVCWYKTEQGIPPGVYSVWVSCGGCCIAWVSVCKRGDQYYAVNINEVIGLPCPPNCPPNSVELCY